MIGEYYKGGAAYQAIRLRNKDGSYVNLEALDGLVVLFYIDTEQTVVFRKDNPGTGELPMRKVTSEFYETTAPGSTTKNMQTGRHWCEVGILQSGAGMDEFISIVKFKSYTILESEMGKYLPPIIPTP